MNFGNFRQTVLKKCKDLYKTSTKKADVEKCAKDAGPPFIKEQKATVADVKKDGDALVQKERTCSKNLTAKYKKMEKNIKEKCGKIA